MTCRTEGPAAANTRRRARHPAERVIRRQPLIEGSRHQNFSRRHSIMAFEYHSISGTVAKLRCPHLESQMRGRGSAPLVAGEGSRFYLGKVAGGPGRPHLTQRKPDAASVRVLNFAGLWTSESTAVPGQERRLRERGLRCPVSFIHCLPPAELLAAMGASCARMKHRTHRHELAGASAKNHAVRPANAAIY